MSSILYPSTQILYQKRKRKKKKGREDICKKRYIIYYGLWVRNIIIMIAFLPYGSFKEYPFSDSISVFFCFSLCLKNSYLNAIALHLLLPCLIVIPSILQQWRPPGRETPAGEAGHVQSTCKAHAFFFPLHVLPFSNMAPLAPLHLLRPRPRTGNYFLFVFLFI